MKEFRPRQILQLPNLRRKEFAGAVLQLTIGDPVGSPMDDRNPSAEALAATNGKILAGLSEPVEDCVMLAHGRGFLMKP